MKKDDQIQRTREYLLSFASRIRDDPGRASAILSELIEPEISTDLASEVASSILTDIHDLDNNDPYLAYALIIVLEQWIPEGAKPEVLVNIYQTLAKFRIRSNDIDEAIDAYSIACTIAQRAGQNMQFIACATNLATTLRRAGRPVEALPVYEDAIQAIDAATPPTVQAMVYTNAATAYSDIGEHEHSVELNQRAIEILTNQPDQQLSLAVAIINLGGCYSEHDQISEAEAMFLKALALTRQENIPSQEAVALGHLGLIRFRQNRISDAIRYLEKAVQMSENMKDSWNAQHWHRDLANVYTWTAFPEMAVHHFEKALSLSRKVHDLRSEAMCLLGLGINSLSQDVDKGISFMNQAWELHEQTHNFSAAIEVALHLSRAYVAKSLDLEKVTSMAMEGMSWEAATRDLVKHPDALVVARQWLDNACHLSENFGGTVRTTTLAFQQADILRLEGQPQDAIGLLQDALNNEDDPKMLVNCHVALAKLYSDTLGKPDMAMTHFQNAISGLEFQSENLDLKEHRIRFRNNYSPLFIAAAECALASDQPDIAFAYCERSKLAEMRRLHTIRGIPSVELSALEDVSRMVDNLSDTCIIEFMPGRDKTLVFVVAPHLAKEEQIHVIENVGQFTFGQLWIKIAQSYKDSKSPMAAFDPEARNRWQLEVKTACMHIGENLLRPIFEKIKDLPLSKIVFIPHSVLRCFPLHAAPLSEAEAWIDRYSISYALSASILVHQWNTLTNKPSKFSAFADPLGDLPMARIEVQRAAELFWGTTQVYPGKDATRNRVLTALQQADWIHFACHAMQTIDDDHATGVYLATSGDNEDEGFLTLHTINKDLRLRENATVVLSACETGTVTPHLSDEFISLAGGFITAGANAVVSTYWKVQDACALLVLYSFYKELRNNQAGLSAALRNAQIWVRGLNEAQVYHELKTLIESANDLETDRTNTPLSNFEAQRDDVFPFQHPVDWAGFFLTGFPTYRLNHRQPDRGCKVTMTSPFKGTYGDYPGR